jgi:hypothetical protein
MKTKLSGLISLGSALTDQLLISFLHLSHTREKWEYNETVPQLFIEFKKAYDSVKREVLYNILIEFGVPMKLVTLIKICLNDIYSKIFTGKLLIHFLSKIF